MRKQVFNRIGASANLLALGVLLSGAAARADDPPPPPNGWTGKGEAGLLLSRGNADATSVNAKLDIARQSGDWKNSAFLAFLYGKNATFATAQSAEERWETDYTLTPRLFVFGALHGIEDRYSGFQYQVTASTGLGYKFFDTDITKLSATLGIGYNRLRPEVLVKDPSGEVTDRIKGDPTGNGVGTLGVNFMHVLSKTTKILDKLQVESGSLNTAVQNDLSLQVSMTDALALSIGYGVRYNSDPTLGSKTTDQLTTINLVYNIK